MARTYYMLIASLPHLPYFLKAERLPVNRDRLRWRRSVLAGADAADLDCALDLLQWDRQPAARTDDEVNGLYGMAMQQIRSVALRSYIEFRMGRRSVMAGLRRRHLGLPAPAGTQRCGVGEWDGVLRRVWDREDFGLAKRFPWLPHARRLLDAGEALDLEKLLMEDDWRRLSVIAESRPFAFEAVFAYVFKWDILRRWLSCKPQQATVAFKSLVQEIIDEQRPN